jgi:hypothetical protein
MQRSCKRTAHIEERQVSQRQIVHWAEVMDQIDNHMHLQYTNLFAFSNNLARCSACIHQVRAAESNIRLETVQVKRPPGREVQACHRQDLT